jgi:hypothetical protein
LPGESEKEYRNLERIWNEAYAPKPDHQHLPLRIRNKSSKLYRKIRRDALGDNRAN